MNEEELKAANKSLKQWVVGLVICFLMVSGLSAHLLHQLRLSRSNEQEMSRRYYELGKYGTYRPVTNESTIKTNSVGARRSDGSPKHTNSR